MRNFCGLEVGRDLLYISRDDIVGMERKQTTIIHLIERSLSIHGMKEVEMPAKIGIHPKENTFIHAMPAYIQEHQACGIKWAAGFPENRELYGLPQITALLTLNDPETGLPVAVMDASWITTVRTAAVTAVAARYLSNTNSETFGMIGCGEVGRKHVEFIANVLPKLKKIFIYDVSPQAMERLIQEIQPQMEVEIIQAASMEEVVKSSLIVASATVITEQPRPQIKDEWIRKGQTILLCDLHTLYEDKTMKKADKYFVDSIEQNKLFQEYGYYPAGIPTINGELGEVVAGLKKGREHENELVIGNNIGMAVEDIMVGKAIFEAAANQGIGQTLKL
ncbi:ornithine cyclodeaminase family protein [Bacillus piscicola]|uniref:ornithine cyclodeaminase family protein n=1 Tax=Bacillus piscicola TaxID=1632684 RepID=UPI001F097284|nr:ornithine cyclodeaminase family protein [Bacillus piscicola]